jgi:chorismate synthase
MSSFGRLFKISTFGESHGIGVGCIIENMPPNFKITTEDIQYQLNRRKPNQNSLLSNRNEPDIVEIYSGVQDGITLGTPLCLVVKNQDMKPGDYKKFSNVPRPGHADLTYLSKYGVMASSGGGRASARETVARVASGAVADKFLKNKFGVEIVSWVNSVGDVEISKGEMKDLIKNKKLDKISLDRMSTFESYKCDCQNESEKEIQQSDNGIILLNFYFNKGFYCKGEEIISVFDLCNQNEESNEFKFISNNSDNSEKKFSSLTFKNIQFNFTETINIRCPCPETAVKMILRIMKVKSECDSIGGTVSCVIRNCPRSLGEPCFDKFEAELAKAMLSIPATKGFEIGSGFEGTKMK